ncbi:T9SS C-terminal target domain-containing protein [candidate division KSB1 bacterium]|nr:MAG: T9SS C-terminal target domain-containing protein [candidate division KSB1 bacterium]
MTTYCFSIKIEPLCADSFFFRIRSWMSDSYGPFYIGNPNYPAMLQNQWYNFTNEDIIDGATTIPALGCYEWGPDVIYLYIDARNAADCVCPIRVTYTGDAPLPVLLNSFSAVASDGRVNLTWVTRSESDVASYEIVRDGAAIARVNGLGNSATGHTYTYADNAVENGRTYRYTLTSFDVNGNAISHNLVATATPNVGLGVAEEYALSQNYPNPFNPSTSIMYTVKEAGLVTLKVYSVDGREVTTLVNETKNAGIYNVGFDGSNLASGVYLYTMKVNGFEATHKMVLMK